MNEHVVVFIVGCIALPIYIVLMVKMVRASRRLRVSMEAMRDTAVAFSKSVSGELYDSQRKLFHAAHGVEEHVIDEEP